MGLQGFSGYDGGPVDTLYDVLDNKILHAFKKILVKKYPGVLSDGYCGTH